MENLNKYINSKHKDLLNSNYCFKDLFNLIHTQEERIFCEFISNFQVKRIKYKEVKKYCYQMGSFLNQNISNNKGKYVGLYMENSVNWIAVFWSLLMIGYKPVLLNCKLPVEMNLEIINQLEVDTVVTTFNTFDSYDFIDVIKLENTLSFIPKVVECALFEDFNWCDEIALCSTATTLNYKLCIYTGSDFTYQVLNAKGILSKNKMIKKHYKGSLKMLCFLPFYHVFGLVAAYIWFSVFGRTFVFLTDYSSETIIKTIRRHEVTHIFAVPLLWNTVVKEVKKEVSMLSEKEQKKFTKGLKLSNKLQNAFPKLGMKIARKLFKRITDKTFGDSISFLISGGGYISDETLYILNGVGYPLHNGYGSSEIGITSVELGKKLKHRIRGAVGKPFDSVSYSIIDDKLMVKGKSTCSYIYPRKGTPYQVNKDEWFDTNDLVRVDKGGSYYILGRADDVVINATGEKINPDIIEKHILLTNANNYCVMDYQGELSFIVEIARGVNQFRLNLIYDEIISNVKILNSKGYVINKVYFTHDPMINPNAIKVSRKLLKSKIDNKQVTLHSIDELSEVKTQSQEEVVDSIVGIVKNCFADVLGKPYDSIESDKHFIFELGGTSLDYFSLLMKLKKEFGFEFSMEEQSCSTVNEFAKYIESKISGGSKNEKI